MLPNWITLFRVFLVFLNVWLYGQGVTAAIAAVFLTIVVIWMDALDGWVARRTGQATDMGAIFDITGDRIVENVFWIYFASAGLITFWVPVVVITRGFLTDTVRTLQFEAGKTPFGDKTMMRSSWSRFLVAGRFMRGLYGGVKAAAFCLLGILIVLRGAVEDGRAGAWILSLASFLTGLVVALTVLLCIVRGLPVLWDGRELLLRRMVPRPPD